MRQLITGAIIRCLMLFLLGVGAGVQMVGLMPPDEGYQFQWWKLEVFIAFGLFATWRMVVEIKQLLTTYAD